MAIWPLAARRCVHAVLLRNFAISARLHALSAGLRAEITH